MIMHNNVLMLDEFEEGRIQELEDKLFLDEIAADMDELQYIDYLITSILENNCDQNRIPTIRLNYSINGNASTCQYDHKIIHTA